MPSGSPDFKGSHREVMRMRSRLRELQREVTRARRSELIAQLGYQQLLSILDSFADIAYVADIDTYEILYANQALKDRFGKDPTGGKCYREFQGRGEPCPFCTNPQLLSEPGKPIYWEYHNPVLSRDFFLIDRLIRWPDGRMVRCELALDITEKKRAEREIQSLYSALPAGVGMVSYPERRILKVNERLCEMLGYREEELVGKGARILYPSEEEYQRVGREKYDLIRERGVGSIETRWVRKDGKIIHVLLSSTFVNPKEPEEGTVFTALDITEIKRLREYRERAGRVILGLGPDPLRNLSTILSGVRDILECKQAACLSLRKGKPTVLFFGEGTRRFEHPESVDRGALVLELWQRGELYGHLPIRDLDLFPEMRSDPVLSSGEYRSCLLYPLWWGGEVSGVLYALDDKTRDWTPEDVEVMALMARSMGLELERLNREEELTDFLDVAAHELRHPATVLFGYASTFASHKESLSEEETDYIIEAMVQGSQRLAGLANRLMSATRLRIGRFHPDLVEVDMLELAKKVASEMRARGYENPISVHTSSPLTILRGDGTMLHDLLVNLVENAVIFSPPGFPVDIHLERSDNDLLVSVLDRGEGIPDHLREAVFDRFFQVEEATHHSRPGIGLGLYIAREIVKAHGGKIWNEPREGGGTIFRFTLPLSGGQ
ncbi:MAG: ATP-binding protein [Candidatus Geothermincolales bacterium]